MRWKSRQKGWKGAEGLWKIRRDHEESENLGGHGHFADTFPHSQAPKARHTPEISWMDEGIGGGLGGRSFLEALQRRGSEQGLETVSSVLLELCHLVPSCLPSPPVGNRSQPPEPPQTLVSAPAHRSMRLAASGWTAERPRMSWEMRRPENWAAGGVGKPRTRLWPCGAGSWQGERSMTQIRRRLVDGGPLIFSWGWRKAEAVC